MWRRADNPLAPGDKYEPRRTSSAPSLYSLVHEREERKRGRPPLSALGESLSHRVMAATDRPSVELVYNRFANFFLRVQAGALVRAACNSRHLHICTVPGRTMSRHARKLLAIPMGKVSPSVDTTTVRSSGRFSGKLLLLSSIPSIFPG